jgi:2-hydroxy-3-oxopropionate reductase
MTNIAFIGLGIMGGPMAANLVKAGFTVTGFNRSRAAVQRLVGSGGKSADSLAEAARDVDVIITMLPDTPDVKAIALSDEGLLATAKPGSIYVDMSTVDPALSRLLAEAGKERGIRVLDAPVSGGQQGAVEGSLSIMVGGDREDFEAAMPVLSALGTTIAHVGPSGSGQIVKAANQLLVAGTIELVAESLVLLEAYRVDTTAAIRVLGAGLGGNRILERKGESMLGRHFTPGFRVDLQHKDLGIALGAARDIGVVTPLGSLVAQLVSSLRAQGHGSLDHSALIKVVESLSGRG